MSLQGILTMLPPLLLSLVAIPANLGRYLLATRITASWMRHSLKATVPEASRARRSPPIALLMAASLP